MSEAKQVGEGKKGLRGYYVKKIGEHRGRPRVWLEGAQALGAGFTPGTRFDVAVEGQTVVLTVNTDGSRIVSGKKIGERMNPVIDLNSPALAAIFDGMAAIRVAAKDGQIYLLPLASELKKQERFTRLRQKLEAGEPLAIGSLSHGGGILSHAIHAGLASAGIETKLAFANDIREDLLEHAAVHNDAWSQNTVPYGAPMQELAFDERGLASVPRVEVVECGIPCSGASRAGKSKNGLENAESHPLVGHLVVSALVILSKANPAVVLIENVPDYARTASADILRNQLRDMGYKTQERIMRGRDWNTIEDRDRWYMVAVTHGIEFDFDQLMPPAERQRRLGEVLEDIASDDPRWSTMGYLKEKEQRDRAAGKNFAMQVVTPESEHVGTIGRGYAKVRSTEPKIRHPTNPDLLRQLTVREHAAVKDVPGHLVEGWSNTAGHEMLGQGVVYPVPKDVGHHVGNSFNRFAGREEVPLPNRRGLELPGADLVAPETAAMAGEILATLQLADPNHGHYVGAVAVADDGVVIQETGRGQGIVHQLSLLDDVPNLGAPVEVRYRGSMGHVLPERAKGRETSGRGVAA